MGKPAFDSTSITDSENMTLSAGKKVGNAIGPGSMLTGHKLQHASYSKITGSPSTKTEQGQSSASKGGPVD